MCIYKCILVHRILVCPLELLMVRTLPGLGPVSPSCGGLVSSNGILI